MIVPKYLLNLSFEKDISTTSGNIVHCYCLDTLFDEATLQEWAHRIRDAYVDDETISKLINNGVNIKAFLDARIPKSDNKRGCSMISGDFAELLMTDFREYILKENAFRGKLESKPTPNSPIQGCDILTYIIDGKDSTNDQLIVTESKSVISSTNYTVLSDAAMHSGKDSTRIGETLAFLTQFYLNKNDYKNYEKVIRFTKKAELPFSEKFEASGITVCCCLDEKLVNNALETIKDAQKIVYFIHGSNLKELAYDLYRRAIDDK